MDSSGNPQVAYTTGVKLRYQYGNDWMGSALKYASWTGSGWDIQTIGSDMNNSFNGISIALDKNDKPYILYNLSSETRSDIMLAKRQTSNWIIQDVQLPASTHSIGNIVVDSQSLVHFICKQPYQNSTYINSILYASYTQSQWNTQTVTSEIDGGYVGKLVLDKQDNPHFIYSNHDGETKYAVYSGSNWNTETLPSGIGVGNLVLDQNGNPHTFYRTDNPARYIDNIVYAAATESTSPQALPNVPDLTTLAVAAVVGFTVVALAVVIVASVWKRKGTTV